MQRLQLVVTSAILVALVAIAFELQAIRRELQPFATLSGSLLTQAVARTNETREQRTRRIQREQQELNEDIKAIWDTPSTNKAPAKPSTSNPR